MQARWLYGVGIALVPLIVAGCATTGSDVESTIFDTHARVVRLDTSLQESVTQLNATAADLSARVDATDQETRQINSKIEEVQRQQAQLSQQVQELQRSVARALGVTPGGAGSVAPVNPGTRVGDFGIESPSGALAVPPPPRIEPSIPADMAERAAPTQVAVAGDSQLDFQTAMRAYAGEQFAESSRLFRDFVGRYPNSTNAGSAEYWLGKSLIRLGQFPEAIRTFEAMRAKYPTDAKIPFAMQSQATAHVSLGQIDPARTLLEEVVADHPTSPAAEQAARDLRRLAGT